MPILDVIAALAEVGLPGVEIGTPPRHFDVWQRPQVEAVRAALRRTSIRAVAIHAPFGGTLDLSDPNAHHRHAAMGAILTAAEVLRALGGSIVVVHAADVSRDVYDADERLRHACHSIATLQTACHDLGMVLALESPLGHLIGGTPEQFNQLLHAGGPDLRVCLDTGHTTLGGQWNAFVDLVGSRIVHVHAHDHRGIFDDHLPPTEGVIQWESIARRLRLAHFEGWIMLELRCPEEPLARYFARAAQQLAQALRMPAPAEPPPMAQSPAPEA